MGRLLPLGHFRVKAVRQGIKKTHDEDGNQLNAEAVDLGNGQGSRRVRGGLGVGRKVVWMDLEL